MAIVAGVSAPKEQLEDFFGEVVEAGRASCEYSISLESKGLGTKGPIYVCRKPNRPIAEVWVRVKQFN